MDNIFVIFILGAFLIVCSCFNPKSDILSPARIFGFTWSIVFGLMSLKLSRLQFDWSPMEWMIALMGPCSFLIGLFIVFIMNINSQLLSLNEIRFILKQEKIKDSPLYYLIITAFIIYLIGYISIIFIKGQIPIFALKPSAARTDFSSFGVGLFIHTMPVIVFFSLVYHIYFHDRCKRKRIIKLIAFITLLTYLFLLQRYQLIMAAVMTFTMLYYATKSIKLKTMLIYASLGVSVIYTIATLRSGKIIQLALYKTSLMKFDVKYAIFTEPYMYIVMNLENFIHSVGKLEHYTYGYYTFNYILSATGIKHWVEEYYSINDTPFLFSGYNTYTLFWSFYRDFGLLGITIVPLLLGFFVGYIYYSLRRQPSIERLSIYCLIVFLMALSFFVNLLGFLWFVYILIWMIVILKSIKIKKQYE